MTSKCNVTTHHDRSHVWLFDLSFTLELACCIYSGICFGVFRLLFSASGIIDYLFKYELYSIMMCLSWLES